MSKKSKPSNPISDSKPRFWQTHRDLILWSAALVLLVALVFGQLASYSYINLDDPSFVFSNAVVQAGLTWPGLLYTWQSYDQGGWHPVTWLSHMAVVQFAGVEPGAHHVANILLHAANVVVLLILLRRLTGALVPSALVAAVFAIHPMHVEAVAWIAQRKELLATLFCLLALLTWLEWTRARGKRWYWITVGLFAFGAMSNPAVGIFPVLLLLLDYWPLARAASLTLGRRVVEKAPFWVLSVGAGVAAYWAQSKVGELSRVADVPLATRLMSVPDNYLFYLVRTFWPFRLAPYYYFSGQVRMAGFAIGLAVLVVITGLILWKGRSKRYLAVGWLWFLAAIAPMAGFVSSGSSIRSDAFSYLAHVGLILLIVWGLSDALGSYRGHVAVRVFAGVVLLLLTARAWHQTSYWSDSLTLFRHTLDVTGENPVANLQVAEALRVARRPREAVPYIEKALQQNPENSLALLADARLKAQLKQPEEALATLDRAVRLTPNSAVIHYQRGLVLEHLRKEDECRAAFQKAVDLPLDSNRKSRALFGIGRSLMRVKREPEAIDYFRRSLELDPYDYLSRKNLGFALIAAERYVEAHRQFQTLASFNGNRHDQDVDKALQRLNAFVKVQ